MRFSRTLRRLLALPACAPLAVLVVGVADTVIAHRLPGANTARSSVGQILRDRSPADPATLVLIVLAVYVAALALYVPLMLRAARPTGASKRTWLMLFVFGGLVAMPVYWYLHVWRDAAAAD